MKQLSKREQVLCVAVALVFAFGLFKYGYLRLHQKNVAAQQQLQTLQTGITSETIALTSLLQQRRPSSDLGPKTGIEKYIDENSQFAALVSKLTESNSKLPYDMVRITAEDVVEEKGYTKIKYSVLLEAPFLSVGAFVERLETSNLFLEITEVNLERTNTDMRKVFSRVILNNYVTRK